MASVEVAPVGVADWYAHPRDDLSQVMEGQATMLATGQPPRQAMAGDGFVIPIGVTPYAHNAGAAPTKLVDALLVETG
jgi:quercetin dioxygenase-like cupin family protein